MTPHNCSDKRHSMKVHLEFGGGLEKKKSFRGRYEVQNSKLIETVDN